MIAFATQEDKEALNASTSSRQLLRIRCNACSNLATGDSATITQLADQAKDAAALRHRVNWRELPGEMPRGGQLIARKELLSSLLDNLLNGRQIPFGRRLTLDGVSSRVGMLRTIWGSNHLVVGAVIMRVPFLAKCD